MADEKKVEKIIPSKLETGFQKFVYRTFGKLVPKNATPNQVTMVGALAGLFAIVCVVLTRFSPWFFIGVILGVIAHLIADDLDGYVARERGMGSKAGAYLDLLTDILFSTFLLVAFGFSGYANIRVIIFAVPLYALINFTSMNYILYYNEFLFPRVGPIEAHLCYIALAVGGMVLGPKPLFTLWQQPFMLADIILGLCMIPMYYETIRLQIKLFKRLKRDGK